MVDFRSLYASLTKGDASAVLAQMTPDPRVQDQVHGDVVGASAVQQWVATHAAWCNQWNGRPREVACLVGDHRVVLELSLMLTVDGEDVDLPFVLAGDLSGGQVSELRTYHSTWPYTAGHVFRAPPLTGRPSEPVPEIFRQYIERVKRAQIEPVLESFTTDGYVREPSGERYKHQGPKGRADFYGHLTHAPRAQFQLMACLTDGPLIAVEYAFAYGDTPLVGGICIMQTEGEQIAAVRITDDVSV